MKVLYVSDLDGTLLDRSAKLSRRSAKIIGGLIKKGMLFSVATARSQSSVSILKDLEINIPCIQLNGVLMYDFMNKKYIGCTPMETETADRIISILKKFDKMSFVYKFDEDCGINVEFERLQNEVERNFFNARKDQDYKSFRQVDNIRANESDRIIYFTMVDEYERLKPIYEEIKKLPKAKPTLYSDNYSDLYFLEVFSADATKAAGVLKLKEMLKADKVVAFGDNLNDIDMLRVSDVGVAVGDCVEAVKEYADIIIGKSYEDGVAEYLLREFV